MAKQKNPIDHKSRQDLYHVLIICKILSFFLLLKYVNDIYVFVYIINHFTMSCPESYGLIGQ